MNIKPFDLGQAPTILIVDDDRINQEVLVELLKPYYKLKVASNGIRALEIAQHTEPPDLILLDIMMPEMDGYQVCQRLKEGELTRNIPIIFVTANACSSSESKGLQLGAVDYISKPFQPEIILLRVRNQILLRQSNMRLRLAGQVFENTMEGIMIADPDCNIISVNPAFTKITGYTLEDVAGQKTNMFKSGVHDNPFYQNMWHDINTHGHWQGEIWDKKKNGELHAKFLNICSVFSKDCKLQCYIGFFSDITARKQHEEEIKHLSDSELNRAKLEAEKANRAKSEFLSSMSHELRTPMNAVLGFAQLLELDELTEDQKENVEQILTAGYHLMELINDVLDLAKIEENTLTANIETVVVDDLIQNCVSLMKPLAEKSDLKLIDRITGHEKISVKADLLRLKQVVLNLVSNAIKYNRKEGRVILSCETLAAENRLRIKVADTGNGLSPEQLEKLFNPFERLSAKNSNIEGTGIGLCICKKLIEAMEGDIGVSSVVGEGSCFWVDIPLA